MEAIVVIDGEVCPPAEQKVSIFDRGFLYGDSVYETLRTYEGRPFAVEEHVERLRESARGIAFEVPFTDAELIGDLHVALGVATWQESAVRLIVTRGSGELGLDPSNATNPTRVAIVYPLRPPQLEAYRDGVEVALVSTAELPRRAMPPGVKTGNYLVNLLALRVARERGAQEALVVSEGARITEGAQSNVFCAAAGTLLTPPLEAGILSGITRRRVLELAKRAGIVVEERIFTSTELLAADECFICSTTREVLPVTRVDGQAIGNGKPGSMTRRLHAALRESAGVAALPLP